MPLSTPNPNPESASRLVVPVGGAHPFLGALTRRSTDPHSPRDQVEAALAGVFETAPTHKRQLLHTAVGAGASATLLRELSRLADRDYHSIDDVWGEMGKTPCPDDSCSCQQGAT